MLVIRDAQMKAFARQMQKNFENGLVRDIKSRFPSACAKLQEPGVRQLVHHALRKSRELGIEADDEIENLLDLMVLLGECFYDDPEFAFEAAPLRDETLPPDARVSLTMARLGLSPPLSEDQQIAEAA